MTLPPFTPAAARALREHASWTQAQAAAAVHYADKSRWSELERGIREPGPAVWELACIKAGLHPLFGASPVDQPAGA